MTDEINIKEMNNDEILELMHEDLYDGYAEEIVEEVEELLSRGLQPYEILTKGLVGGMDIVGVDFRDGILFVPEVLMAAKAMKAGMAVLRPLLAETGAPKVGTVVIGTVKGDIHDIGKNLVTMMLEGAGFEIVDLGTDVDPAKFVESAKDGAQAIGMSALLTTTMNNMKGVIDAVVAEGIRDDVKIVIGGAPVTKDFASEIGADGYAPDASSAVRLVKDLLRA